MAFLDPQSIKVDGTNTISLPRVDATGMKSRYLSADGLTEVVLSTQEGKRVRHMARVNLAKIIPSALAPSSNEEATASLYVIVDRPSSGYTNEELKKAMEGFVTFLSASTYSATSKLLGRES